MKQYEVCHNILNLPLGFVLKIQQQEKNLQVQE